MMTREQLFFAADTALNAGKPSEKYELLRASAREGYSYALNSVGYMLDHGLGVRLNRRAALFWYYKGARAGDICAINNIGICFKEDGNLRNARIWLLRALNKGNGDAALELARMYFVQGGNCTSVKKYLRRLMVSRSATEHSLAQRRNLMGRTTRRVG